MPLLENPGTVAQMIRDGLAEFAATYPNLIAARAVVWFEPEHDHCGLYLSTDATTSKLLPTEFDFQNYAVADTVASNNYQDHLEDFCREVKELVRSLGEALPATIKPKRWAVQVSFAYYDEWEY